MAKQFSKRNSRATTKTAMANVVLDESLTAQPDTVQIIAWLSRLHLLYGVPFNYLVPDIRMLPDESIRFFQVDSNWITALIDGAFSPGTTLATSIVSQAMQPQVQAYVNENLSSVRAQMLDSEQGESSPANLSGFFLRSAAVSGWPGMEVAAYSDAEGHHELAILRMERISPSLLLCLFNGIVARVEMRQPGESIHFTFNPAPVQMQGIESVTDDTYFKSARYVNSYGNIEAGMFIPGMSFQVPVGDNGVVSISPLANSMATNCWAPGTPQEDQVFTSAEFGLAMVNNSDFVTIQLNS